MQNETSWAYLPVINAVLQILLTVGLGGIMGALGVFKAEVFVPLAVRFVFYVALPCLVLKGIGIGVDFYSDKFLWMYIVAFLVLRAIALVVSMATVLFSNWREKRPSKGLGDVTVLWLTLTWISTVILGIPICEAVFGSPSKGQKYGLLAGISSFIFQLPLQLMFLECHSLKESRQQADPRRAEEEVTNSTDESDLENGLEACKAVQVSPSKREAEPRDKSDEASEEAMAETKWWSLVGGEYVRNADLWLKIAMRVLRNPVLWGIFWGFVLSLSTAGKYLRCNPNPLPSGPDCIEGLAWINLTLTWFGNCVSPVSLFAMGLWMHSRGLRGLFPISIGRLSLFMLSKLVLVPFMMVGLAKSLNFTDEAGRAAVLIAALPISLASFSLGGQYKIGEADLAANVTAGTILMLPTLLVWNVVMDKIGLFSIG